MAEPIQFDERAAEEAKPTPPRYWWLKRLSLAAGVFVLFMVGLRLWWGWEADRRLRAKIAEYRAAGQPVLLEDFRTSPVPDEENGAHFLLLAAAKLPSSATTMDMNGLVADPQQCAARRDAVGRLLEASGEVLALVRAARSKRVARWNTALVSPAINIFPPNLSPQRQLAKLTCVAALYHHQTGNDAEAVASLRDVLALAGHLEDGEAFLIAHMVRMAIDALAARTAEGFTYDLRVALETGPRSAEESPAPRADVEALIRELLDERSLQQGLMRAMYAERMMELDTALAMAEGRMGFSALGRLGGRGGSYPPFLDTVADTLLAPAWKLDAIRMMDYSTGCADAGSAASWPAAQTRLPPEPARRSLAHDVSRVLSLLFLSSLDRTTFIHFRAVTDRRLAATALAVRLYELDHGLRPSQLVKLVPEYLPAIPLDPFDAGNGELRYLPHAPSPLLYSVGTNGRDDGGAYGLRPSGGIDLDAKDHPFFLNGDRPRPPPVPPAASHPADTLRRQLGTQPASSQAAPNDGPVEHGERNER